QRRQLPAQRQRPLRPPATAGATPALPASAQTACRRDHALKGQTTPRGVTFRPAKRGHLSTGLDIPPTQKRGGPPESRTSLNLRRSKNLGSDRRACRFAAESDHSLTGAGSSSTIL